MSQLAQILSKPQGKPKRQYEPIQLNPTAFYGRYGIVIRYTGWQMAKCPFHDDTHASLSINGTHGGFICHACGAKGNMIGFYMQYHNTDFKGAMRELRHRGQI